MYIPRLVTTALLAGGLLVAAVGVAPIAAHAAGYTHYKAGCYSLDYPTGWKVKTSGSTTTFSTQSGSVFTVIGGTCVSKAGSIQHLTTIEVGQYQKRGFQVSGKPTYKGSSSTFIARGTFKGQSVLWDVVSSVRGSTGYFFYLFTPANHVNAVKATWLHVLNSVH